MHAIKMAWFILVGLLLQPFALLLIGAINLGEMCQIALSGLRGFRESIAPYPYTKEQEARINKQLEDDL